MVTYKLLRAAGLTQRQADKVMELIEDERKERRKEQNRRAQQKRREKQRACQQKTADKKAVEKPKRNQRSSQQMGADSQHKKSDTNVDIDAKFEELWNGYPRRGEASNPKKPARERFERHVKAGVNPDLIIMAARRYRDIERKAGRDGTDKIAQTVTWLNQERWNDYPELAAIAPVEAPRHGQQMNGSGVYIMADTPEWEAWRKYLKSQGKVTPPTTKAGGWSFPTLWPPGHEKPQMEMGI